MVHRCEGTKKNQILYAGTLLRRKGYDVLLKAFGKIAKSYPDWKNNRSTLLVLPLKSNSC